MVGLLALSVWASVIGVFACPAPWPPRSPSPWPSPAERERGLFLTKKGFSWGFGGSRSFGGLFTATIVLRRGRAGHRPAPTIAVPFTNGPYGMVEGGGSHVYYRVARAM